MKDRFASAGSLGPLLLVLLGLVVGLGLSAQPALALMALFGGGLALLALRWPPLLVGGMFVGILFDRIGLTGMKVADFPITASKLTVLGSLGLWALHVVLSRSVALRWHPVLSALVGVVAVTGLTMAWSGTMQYGKFVLFGLIMMSVLVALVYAVLADYSLSPLFRGLGVAFSLVLALSLLHRGAVEGQGNAEGDRSSGTMGDPNEWASMVLLVVPFLLGGLADDRHPLARPLRMVLVLLTPLVILQSESRAALLVLVLVIPGALYLLRSQRGELGLCVGATLVAAPLVVELDTVFARVNRLLRVLGGDRLGQDGSLSERAELLRQGKQLFLDHWLMGAGPGNFSRATGFIGENGRPRPAHNTYLEIASEQGLTGLVPAAIFMFTVALTLTHAWRLAEREDDRSRITGAMLGLGAFALMAATLGLLTFSMAWLMLGVALALVYQAEHPPAASVE